MVVGYARVSTREQSLDLQIEALNYHGVERIVTEIGSGIKPRANLTSLLSELQAGDSLVIWRLDRLGRTASELLELSHDLLDRRIVLISLKDGIDSSTATGRFLLGVLALVAEMERDVLLERTKAGIQAARHAGRYGGRPPINISRIQNATDLYLHSDLPVREICNRLCISRSSFYKYLAIYGMPPKRHLNC